MSVGYYNCAIEECPEVYVGEEGELCLECEDNEEEEAAEYGLTD